MLSHKIESILCLSLIGFGTHSLCDVFHFGFFCLTLRCREAHKENIVVQYWCLAKR